jgi:hypothetical protein
MKFMHVNNIVYSLTLLRFHAYGGAPRDHSPFFRYTPLVYMTQIQQMINLVTTPYRHTYLQYPLYSNNPVLW